MGINELHVSDEPALADRLQELKRAIGHAKRRGADPSALIAEHQALNERLQREEPQTTTKDGPAQPTLQVFSSPQELVAYKPQFDALLQASSTLSPFLLLEWLLPWYDYFGKDYDLHFVVVRQGDRMLGAAPLMMGEEQRLGKQPVVRFMGTGGGLRGNYFAFAADPGSPVAVALLREHVHGLLGQGRPLHLQHLSPFRDGHDTLSLLTGEPDRELLIRCGTGCVRGWLPHSFAEFVRSVPSQQRRARLRCGDDRMCRHHGELVYEECSAPEQVEDFLRVVQQLSTARHEIKGVCSTWSDETNQRCRIEMGKAMLQRGALRLDVLRCGERRIAALIGFVHKQRYFCYNIGFDPEYASYEPGHLLLARRIRACIEEGLTDFDFLVGDAPYKRQYFRDMMPEMQVTVLPQKGSARLAETARLFARSLKRWR